MFSHLVSAATYGVNAFMVDVEVHGKLFDSYTVELDPTRV